MVRRNGSKIYVGKYAVTKNTGIGNIEAALVMILIHRDRGSAIFFCSDWGWINTHFLFIVPSLFGHGLKGALFVLIFIQFYRRMPSVLEEAVRIDGAGVPDVLEHHVSFG
ncbi:hypothetical protein [Paenibacillus bouchesdurhonensis]|uniref:hypothetical protein n=1 Tax=Paenibacillus bouchesdurhonensis TaxID=1870990 RepID=UPI000DA6124C|nr:hypothetical protein [Paenibacillus bouchesdurhonensis]